MLHRFLCVDPSVRNVGHAIFAKDEKSAFLCSFGVFHPKSIDWRARALEVRDFVRETARGAGVSEIYVEEPHHYDGGKGTVARNSGSILKLMLVVGAVLGGCSDSETNVTLISVQTWKGNLPKEITQKRVLRAWGVSGDHNAIDAVGIGDYLVRRVWRLIPTIQ